MPASVFRYYFYELWAVHYAPASLLMACDFRDIVFQVRATFGPSENVHRCTRPGTQPLPTRCVTGACRPWPAWKTSHPPPLNPPTPPLFTPHAHQRDPFTHHQGEWHPEYQLVLFQEFHPNMVIHRCRFNRRVVRECYGEDTLRTLGPRWARPLPPTSPFSQEPFFPRALLPRSRSSQEPFFPGALLPRSPSSQEPFPPTCPS